MKIEIGFFAEDKEPDTGINLAELVKVLEFNSTRENQFPFMLDVYENNKEKWNTMLKIGKNPKEVAKDIKKKIEDKIKNNNYNLAISTILRKKSDKALIESKFLLNHVRIKIDGELIDTK